MGFRRSGCQDSTKPPRISIRASDSSALHENPIRRFGARLLRCHELADASNTILVVPGFQRIQPARALPISHRSRTKARVISTFTCTARSLFSTDESMATPRSVNA